MMESLAKALKASRLALRRHKTSMQTQRQASVKSDNAKRAKAEVERQRAEVQQKARAAESILRAPVSPVFMVEKQKTIETKQQKTKT